MKNYLIFDIGGTFIKWSLIDENYNIIKSNKFESNGKTTSAKVLMKKIGDKINKIEQEENILAIGISTAGTVNPIDSTMLGDIENIKDYSGLNIKKELSVYTNKRIFVENDANAAIIGEMILLNENCKNILMITLGTDIGGGIIIDRNIYRGSNGFAGEVGFQIIDNKRWGEHFSTIGLINSIKTNYNLNLTAKEILESKEMKIQNLVDYWYKGLANGIANLIVSMNFDSIIIGGGISESELFNISKIQNYTNQFLKLSQFVSSYKLLKAKRGNNAAIYGMTKIIKDSLDN